MKVIYGFLIILFMTIIPAFAQQSLSSNDIVAKMKTQLDLQDDQVANITPIIDKYALAFQDLQKSIADGNMNQSAIDSQRQGIEEEETQELSVYLKPYQLSEWRAMQSQMDQAQGSGSSDDSADADEYSNLPRNTPSS